jgi:hypothetical protein
MTTSTTDDVETKAPLRHPVLGCFSTLLVLLYLSHSFVIKTSSGAYSIFVTKKQHTIEYGLPLSIRDTSDITLSLSKWVLFVCDVVGAMLEGWAVDSDQLARVVPPSETQIRP